MNIYLLLLPKLLGPMDPALHPRKTDRKENKTLKYKELTSYYIRRTKRLQYLIWEDFYYYFVTMQSEKKIQLTFLNTHAHKGVLCNGRVLAVLYTLRHTFLVDLLTFVTDVLITLLFFQTRKCSYAFNVERVYIYLKRSKCPEKEEEKKMTMVCSAPSYFLTASVWLLISASGQA